MKKTVSALAFAAAIAAGAAQAADLPSRKEAPVYAPPPPVFSWTGLYVGVNLGGGWLTNNSNNLGWGWGGNNSNSGGVVGGGQIGYNYQIGSMFVVGLETDFQGTSIGSGANNSNWWALGLGNGFANGASARVDWFGTVRGRVGVTLFSPQLLVYGTGGFAYGGITGNGLWQWNETGTGWTAGGGVEYAFTPNWSAKVEYLYTDLSGNGGNNSNWLGVGWNGGNNWRTHTRFNTVRAGLNYRLNWFNTAAPVLASY